MYFDTTLRHVLSWSEDYTFIGILVLSCYWWLRVANLSHAARALNQHWLFNLSWPWVHTQNTLCPKQMQLTQSSALPSGHLRQES